MEYTKGEWGFRGMLPIGFHVYSKNTNNAIATGIENKDDAQLISAAPDLYEAAKEVMDTLHQYGGGIVPHLMDTDENAGQRLREALAKAEGK